MPTHCHNANFSNGHASDFEVEEPPHPHHEEVKEPDSDKTRGVKEWIGQNIFAILGIGLALGIFTVPASRWQHEALSSRVEGMAQSQKDEFKEMGQRVKKVEDAQVETRVWQSRVEAKLDQIGDKLSQASAEPAPAAASAPASPAPSPASIEKPKRAVAKRPPQKPVAQSSSWPGFLR